MALSRLPPDFPTQTFEKHKGVALATSNTHSNMCWKSVRQLLHSSDGQCLANICCQACLFVPSALPDSSLLPNIPITILRSTITKPRLSHHEILATPSPTIHLSQRFRLRSSSSPSRKQSRNFSSHEQRSILQHDSGRATIFQDGK